MGRQNGLERQLRECMCVACSEENFTEESPFDDQHDHQQAMRGWTRLRELRLPRWEGRLDTIVERDAPPELDSAVHTIACQLARVLPSLELLCYSGNLSSPDWARVRRRDGEDPADWQVEIVSMLNMDLGRP